MTCRYCVSTPFAVEAANKFLQPLLNYHIVDHYPMKILDMSIRRSKQNDIHDTIDLGFQVGTGMSVQRSVHAKSGVWLSAEIWELRFVYWNNQETDVFKTSLSSQKIFINRAENNECISNRQVLWRLESYQQSTQSVHPPYWYCLRRESITTTALMRKMIYSKVDPWGWVYSQLHLE